MYILVNARDVYIYNSKTVEKTDKGILVDKGTLRFTEPGIEVYEITAVPSNVKTHAFCYDPEKREFYPNPDFAEPPKPIDEEMVRDNKIRIEAIESAVTDMMNMSL